MRKVRSNVMLVLPNITIEPSFARKKKIELPNMTKVQSHMILALHNLKMVPSNVKKKKKNTSATERGKSTVMCNVDIT